MFGRAEVVEGFLDDKVNLLNDLSIAYKAELYSDITFVTADNVKISANKFMLASRVPYFASMLFGGFAESIASEEIPLKCCESNTFREILNFVYQGGISFSGMSITSLLDLLQVSRLFCIDILQEGAMYYLEHMMDKGVDLKECIAALEFSNDNKLIRASDLLIKFIDKNLPSISDLPEFDLMALSSLKMILCYKEKSSPEIERFKAFTRWLKNKDTLEENIKRAMLECFDLNKFDGKDLVNIVMPTNLFSDREVSIVLGEHINGMFEMEKIIEHQNEKCVNLKIENCILQFGIRKVFEIPAEFNNHLFNSIQFDLACSAEALYSYDYVYSYDVESSLDGVTWTKLVTCENKISGHQIIQFKRRKMQFVRVKLNNSRRLRDNYLDFAPIMMDMKIMMI